MGKALPTFNLIKICSLALKLLKASSWTKNDFKWHSAEMQTHPETKYTHLLFNHTTISRTD